MSADDSERVARATDDVDPGAPVEELRALEEETRPDFLHGVRRRIDRRLLAGEVVQLFGSNLLAIVLEFLRSVFQLFVRAEGPRGER